VLRSPTGTERRQTIWYDNNQLRFHLTFSSPYTGMLHLYAVDWSTLDRRQKVTVTDAQGPQQITLSTAFDQGAWLHFPITVAAGGQVTVTADRLAGYNAVLSGLFLGDAIPVVGVPGVPTGVVATPGNATVAVSWTAPASNGGSPITAYTVTATPGAATCSTTGTTNCTVTGLTNGTSYSFAVTATNALGTGSPSIPTSATPATVPGAPTSLVANPGNATIALSWAAPASNGGSVVTAYNIYRGTASGSGTLLAGAVAGLTFSDATAINGTTYFYTVRGLNAVGEGGPSGEASATPRATATVPGAPTGVSATRGDGQVTLRWTAPVSNGGSPVTGYTATGTPGGATCTTTGATTCVVTGLANGTTYAFTVTATNAIGTSAPSTPVSATPAAVPGATTALVLTPGNATVGLSWTAPASTGGTVITGYRIYRGTSSGTETLLTTLGNVTTFADNAVANGTTYYYQVSAVNDVGEGARSGEQSARPATLPGVPRNLSAKGDRTRGVDLNWAAPASNGGSAITAYRIYRSTGSGTESFLVSVANVTAYTDQATVKGTRYYYQVTAVNAIGEGSRSTEASTLAK
jgi:fibronectin type 3 domain-containing protein